MLLSRKMKIKRWGRRPTYDEVILLTEEKANHTIKALNDLYEYLGLLRVTYPEKTVIEKVKKAAPSKKGRE